MFSLDSYCVSMINFGKNPAFGGRVETAPFGPKVIDFTLPGT